MESQVGYFWGSLGYFWGPPRVPTLRTRWCLGLPELLRSKDPQLCDDAAGDEVVGSDIEGRIPNPNACGRERGGKKAGTWFCESSQAHHLSPARWFMSWGTLDNLGMLTL